MTTNDGSGIYDNVGLIDTLITDLNELTRRLAAGEYVNYCVKIVEMVQKLSGLKEGVIRDLKDRDERIRELTAALDAEEVEEHV